MFSSVLRSFVLVIQYLLLGIHIERFRSGSGTLRLEIAVCRIQACPAFADLPAGILEEIFHKLPVCSFLGLEGRTLVGYLSDQILKSSDPVCIVLLVLF